MLSDSFILLFFHQNAGFVLGSPSKKTIKMLDNLY